MKIKLVLLFAALALMMGLTGCGRIDATPTGPTMGDRLVNNPGGFTFLSIPDYSLQVDGGAVMMLAPEADVNQGPAIMLMSAVDESLAGIKAVDELPLFLEGTPFDLGEVQAITLNEMEGAIVDLTGAADGSGLVGRAAVVIPAPNRAFLMMGVAPAERWSELEPYFEAVLNSLEFFNPQPENTP